MPFLWEGGRIARAYIYICKHVLIHCPLIWGQWANLFSAFGVYWAYPLLLKDILLSWMLFPIRKNVKALWRATPLNLFWAIWKERNKIVFENASFSIYKLKLSIIRSFFSWAGCISNVDLSFVGLLLYRL